MPSLIDTFVLFHNVFGKLCITDINGNHNFDIDNSYVNEFVKWHLYQLDLHNQKKPFIFCRSYGYVVQLDNFILNNAEYIDNQGLDIFLYEIDFFSYNKTTHLNREPLPNDTNNSFISEVYAEYLDSFNDENTVYSASLDSIENFVRKNNIKNVSVKYLYYNAPQVLKQKYSFEIVYYNICLLAQYNLIEKFYKIENNNNSLEFNILAPFWRYEPYRHFFACYLATKNNVKMSWHYDSPLDILQDNLWFSIKKKQKKLQHKIKYGSELLNENYYTLDIKPQAKTKLTGKNDKWKFPKGYDGYVIENSLKDLYKKSFCVLVGESTFAQPFGTFSEKILIAIKCRNPFVLVGAPFSLLHLKKLGFKTFDQWWDESYDQEQDHEKRLIKILELIDYIDSLTMTEKEKIYSEMSDVLDHNLAVLHSIDTFKKELSN